MNTDLAHFLAKNRILASFARKLGRNNILLKFKASRVILK